MTEITREALEALIAELRCGDPSGAKCDKASDMLIEICRALRTGQLILAQPSETHAEMVKQLRQLARKQEGYGMSFSDPSPREGGMASINLYGDRAKAAIWLFKNADRIADVLSVASKATQPSQDEVAWLIERDDLRTVESGDRVCLHYYAEHRPGRHHWTPDHLKAKRFPTRENALAECNDDPLLRVCEHMWIGPQPSGDEVEGRVIADVVKWLRTGGHLQQRCSIQSACVLSNAATALETGEWRNAQSV